MSREQELKKVKKIIKKNYKYGNCGIFDTKNIVGDFMEKLFVGKYFSLDICTDYCYFELFGATIREFSEIESFYDRLGDDENE